MPLALIVLHAESVMASTAAMVEIPMVGRVDSAFYEEVKDGDTVLVNADEGFIALLNK